MAEFYWDRPRLPSSKISAFGTQQILFAGGFSE
jgi:hypothetical protein